MSRARWIGTLILGLEAGCGGGDGGTVPVPPPPPPGPASLTFTGGADQTAAPGARVAIQPTVIVRDAQNRPVAGATVVFAVEAGGGAIAQGSSNTTADGTASPGDWTLGPAEGQNRLRATVGSLSATLSAQALFPAVPLFDTTIAGTGGTVTYERDGDPLDGLELTIPRGAYPTPTRWIVKARPPQVVPELAAGSVEGSVLEIQTDAGPSDSLLVLRLPHAARPDRFAMAFMRDPATGRMEGLPVASATANALTVASSHFRADLMAERAPAALRRSADEFGKLHVLVASVDFPRLEQPISSGFTPGVDDWEFTNYGSYVAPGGQCTGQSISALWYYYRQRGGSGPLFHRFDTLRDIWEDNPRGYRFASKVQRSIDWDRLEQFYRQMQAIADRNGENIDRLYFYSVAYSILLTGNPQSVGLYSSQGGGHAVIAYATERGKVRVADPNFPGQAREIPFVNNRLGPFASRPNARDGDKMYDRIVFESVSPQIPLSQIDALWPQVESGSIGSDIFPGYRMEFYDWLDQKWLELKGDSVTSYFSGLRLRIICPTCAGALTGGAPAQQLVFVMKSTGADGGVDRGTEGYEATLAGGSNRLGAIVYGWPQNSTQWQWLDYRWIEARALAFAVEHEPETSAADAPIEFTARPMGGAPKTGARYVWDFDDETALVSGPDSVTTHSFDNDGVYLVTVTLEHAVTGRKIARVTERVVVGNPFRIDPNPAEGTPGAPVTLTARNLAASTPSPIRYVWDFGDGKTGQADNDSTVQHSWDAAGTYTVSVVLKHPTSGVEIGRASGQARIVAAKGVWRLTSFVLTSSVIPRNPVEDWSLKAYGDDYVIFQAMQTHPDYALIAYVAGDTTAGGTAYASGAYLVYDATKRAAGVNPAYGVRALARRAVTPPFAADVADALTVSGTLVTGGISGQAVNVKLLFSPFHTLTYWKISSVKEGTLLRGTITRVQTLWEGQGFGQPLKNYGDIVHEWSFRATRVQ